MDKELKAQKKDQKKAYKKALRKARRPWKFLSLLSAPIAIIFAILLLVTTMFDNTIALFVGGTFWGLENEDASAVYYEGDFDTEAERTARGAELVKQVEGEGAALLMNEDVTLPLANGAKVSLFSTSSVNIVYGGTGSANVDTSKCDNLKTALEKEGFAVNQTLWDFYETGDAAIYTREDAGATAQDAAGTDAETMAYGAAEIVEAPWSVYTEDVLASVEEYGDAAIVVLSRIGGEGADSYFDHELGDGKNYLALNDVEKEMMANIKAMKDAGTIDKIVVLINTSNALQVDFLKNNEYGVDATLWIGGVGQTGINAVSGFVSNPMEYAETSKISLYGIADYCWNMEAYDFQANWEKSLKSILPSNHEALRTFALYRNCFFVISSPWIFLNFLFHILFLFFSYLIRI